MGKGVAPRNTTAVLTQKKRGNQANLLRGIHSLASYCACAKKRIHQNGGDLQKGGKQANLLRGIHSQASHCTAPVLEKNRTLDWMSFKQNKKTSMH
jgi:hypothetical protein